MMRAIPRKHLVDVLVVVGTRRQSEGLNVLVRTPRAVLVGGAARRHQRSYTTSSGGDEVRLKARHVPECKSGLRGVLFQLHENHSTLCGYVRKERGKKKKKKLLDICTGGMVWSTFVSCGFSFGEGVSESGCE
jgi:hypothetical protein